MHQKVRHTEVHVSILYRKTKNENYGDLQNG